MEYVLPSEPPTGLGETVRVFDQIPEMELDVTRVADSEWTITKVSTGQVQSATWNGVTASSHALRDELGMIRAGYTWPEILKEIAVS